MGNRIERRSNKIVFDIRNPYVPENFFTLYGTFLDQAHGKTPFKDFTKRDKKTLIMLEETIKEKGLNIFFDRLYIEDMNALTHSQDIPTSLIEARVGQIPEEISEGGQKLAKVITRISENDNNLELEKKLETKKKLIHSLLIDVRIYSTPPKGEIPDTAALKDFYSEFKLEELERTVFILREILAEEIKEIELQSPITHEKDALIDEAVKLEAALFDMFKEKPAEYLEKKEESIYKDLEKTKKENRDLISARNDESKALRMLEIVLSSLKKTLRARKKYGETWQETLENFRLTEKEIYIEWGKRMISSGYEDDFLIMGRKLGYF